MTDVQIGTMDTTIEFESEVATAAPGTPSGGATHAVAGQDLAQLRAILRPLISDLMAEEYGMLRKMTG